MWGCVAPMAGQSKKNEKNRKRDISACVNIQSLVRSEDKEITALAPQQQAQELRQGLVEEECCLGQQQLEQLEQQEQQPQQEQRQLSIVQNRMASCCPLRQRWAACCQQGREQPSRQQRAWVGFVDDRLWPRLPKIHWHWGHVHLGSEHQTGVASRRRDVASPRLQQQACAEDVQ
jgi:hypothetical protein